LQEPSTSVSTRNAKSRGIQRTSQPRDEIEPGHIEFDDRGNAIYQWSDADLTMEGEVGDRLRNMALEHPGLSLMDDTPPANGPIVVNEKAQRLGYNPYESGMIKKNMPKKKSTDLRALSKWIQTQRTKERDEK